MNPCRDQEVLLSLHAAGALDDAEAAPLEAHLAGCAACRAGLAASAGLLDLARLPPPSEAERRALRDLPAATLAALHRTEGRRSLGKRVAAGLAVVAAAALVLAAPALLRPRAPAVPPAAPGAPAAWQEPDLDALWDDTGVLDVETASLDGSEGTNAALAALDAGDGR